MHARNTPPADRPTLLQLGLLPEEDPSNWQHELWLADAYNRSGRYQEAARQYRQLLAQGGEGEGGEQQQQLPEQRIELLCRLADIQVGRAEAPAILIDCQAAAQQLCDHGCQPTARCSPCCPLLQLKLDEAHAGEELEARMAAAGAAPGGGGHGLSGRTTSNLQLEVLSEQAVHDELEAGDAGTAQTLHELCSSECQPAVQRCTRRQPTLLYPMPCPMCQPPGLPTLFTHGTAAVAPPAARFVKYHEEWLKRCLLRIFSAQPRSGGRGGAVAAAALDADAEIHATPLCMRTHTN
jgi:hypothetical protein